MTMCTDLNVVNSLEIIIITYNRQKYLKRTLDAFLAEGSPVQNCSITILDNNSSDGTRALTEETSKSHPNVGYRKNTYNLGISGNIFRAMEIVEKDYAWIVGDDDVYDFSGWHEVEEAMARKERMICLARYAIPDELKSNVPAQLVQLSFITGGIYSHTLFNDASMRDAAYNIFSLFPHLVPVVHFINEGGLIYTVGKAIADYGSACDSSFDAEVSYNRGVQKEGVLSPRTRSMLWIVGWASVAQGIDDGKLRHAVFARGVKVLHKTLVSFIGYMWLSYRSTKCGHRYMGLIGDVLAVAPFTWRLMVRFFVVSYVGSGICEIAYVFHIALKRLKTRLGR